MLYLRQIEAIYKTLESAFVALQKQRVARIDLSPELLAHSLMCYLHGLIHSYLSPGQRTLNLKRDGDMLLDLFLDVLLV